MSYMAQIKSLENRLGKGKLLKDRIFTPFPFACRIDESYRVEGGEAAFSISYYVWPDGKTFLDCYVFNSGTEKQSIVWIKPA